VRKTTPGRSAFEDATAMSSGGMPPPSVVGDIHHDVAVFPRHAEAHVAALGGVLMALSIRLETGAASRYSRGLRRTRGVPGGHQRHDVRLSLGRRVAQRRWPGAIVGHINSHRGELCELRKAEKAQQGR